MRFGKLSTTSTGRQSIFVDTHGRIRYHQFGEGEYERSQIAIQQLLIEAGSSNVGTALVAIKARGSKAGAAPGFLCAFLNGSVDGSKVVMYSQWRAIGACTAMRSDPIVAQLFPSGLGAGNV